MSENAVKVLVVSLPTATERRTHIQRQMEACGVRFEFVDAVDASTAARSGWVDEEVSTAVIRLKSGLLLAKTELACAMSHHRALGQLLSSTAGCGLVLEDDAILQPNFAAFASEVPHLAIMREQRSAVIHCASNFEGDGRDLVLGSRTALGLNSGIRVARVRRLSGSLWGAVGYVVSRRSAESLLSRSPDRADAWKWFLKDGTLDQVWLARPAPVLHPSDAPHLLSQIQEDRQGLSELTVGRGIARKLATRVWSRAARTVDQFLRITLDPFASRLG